MPQGYYQASHVPALPAAVLQSTLPQPLGVQLQSLTSSHSSLYMPSSIQPAPTGHLGTCIQYPSISKPATFNSALSDLYASASRFHQHQVFPAAAPVFVPSAPYRHHERFIEGQSLPYLTTEDETHYMMLKMATSNLPDPRETEQYK